MKKIILIGAVLAAMLSKAKAQENTEKPGPDGVIVIVKDVANKQTEQMASDLKLTPEQKTKVAKLNLTLVEKQTKVRSNPNIGSDERFIKNNEIDTWYEKELKEILTVAQYKQYIAAQEHTKLLKTGQIKEGTPKHDELEMPK